MKRLLITASLLSMAALAQEPAAVEQPEKAKVAEPQDQKNWFSVDDWADNYKLKEGKLSAEILLGYEYADLDGNGLKAAHALLTRTRLQYETANYAGFDAKIMGQYVGPINDKYSPRDPAYDTVADPEAFRLHEVYLAYTGYDTHVRVGSQEIILDNSRFIGNVGWRFNAQSFNAGLVKNESVENLALLYSYADSINAPDGESNHARKYHLFNAQYDFGEEKKNKVSAYTYLQRNDAGADIDTFGARFWGKNSSFVHNAMLAFQRDAYYGFLSGMLDFDPVDVEIGVEYISGGADPREQFQTLDGTAHAFNGWADQFLGTGGGLASGLVDVWAKAALQPMDQMTVAAIYHYFNTADGTPAGGFTGNYGNEIDAEVKYTFSKQISTSATLAYYIEGENKALNPTADETVFWLRGSFRF